MANLTFWRNGTTEFDRFRREMDRLFDTFSVTLGAPFGTPFNPSTAGGNGGRIFHDAISFSPSCEFAETDKFFVIKAELPGVHDKDIDVQVTSNTLIIKGDKKTEHDENKGTYHFTERTFGTYFRTFNLPSAVDTTKIRARYDRGVLEVELPKTTSSSTTKIKVELK